MQYEASIPWHIRGYGVDLQTVEATLVWVEDDQRSFGSGWADHEYLCVSETGLLVDRVGAETSSWAIKVEPSVDWSIRQTCFWRQEFPSAWRIRPEWAYFDRQANFMLVVQEPGQCVGEWVLDDCPLPKGIIRYFLVGCSHRTAGQLRMRRNRY